MGNKMYKRKKHRKQHQKQHQKQYIPRYIIPPAIKFVTYDGYSIKPKHSFVCNGVKGGWYV